MLQGSSDKGASNDGGPQFAEVFVIYWLGATVVTLNIKLLGGSMYVFVVRFWKWLISLIHSLQPIKCVFCWMLSVVQCLNAVCFLVFSCIFVVYCIQTYFPTIETVKLNLLTLWKKSAVSWAIWCWMIKINAFSGHNIG